MSSARPGLYQWPEQTSVTNIETPLPAPTNAYGRSTRRRRRDTLTSNLFVSRQVIADQQEIQNARTQCQLLSGNDVISCFPDANTFVPQSEWTSFVWNSRRPELTQTNLVDLFLFRADSQQQILHRRNFTNPFGEAGVFNAQVNDTWFGTDGLSWNGTNQSFPFYWVIARSDRGLDGSEIPQNIFSAVQTTFLDSVISSRSAAAASASSASASSASASSASVLSSRSAAASSTFTHSPTPTSSPSSSAASGSVQHDGAGPGFPHWAIAVITVLGFLAIASLCVLAFLILRRLRRRNDELESNRNSMGSSSPMMANIQQQGSPLLGAASLPPHSPVGTGNAAAAMGMGLAGGAAFGERDRNAPSVVIHDGASNTSAGDSGPFSGADAAIMADAFRKMLRKPDFAERLEEGDDSPDGGNEEDDDNRHGASSAGLLGRELAEEGRDIRSVSSERGVRVETGTIESDAGSAALGQRGGTL